MAPSSHIPAELFYLSSHFDINMMLTTQIRKILQDQNVPISSATAKKQLVRLFKDKVMARKDEILATAAATAAAPTTTAPPMMTRAAAHQKQKRAEQQKKGKKKQKTKKDEARETRVESKGKKRAGQQPPQLIDASPGPFPAAAFDDSASESSSDISPDSDEVSSTDSSETSTPPPHPSASSPSAVKSPPPGTIMELSTNAAALDDRTRSLDSWVSDFGGAMEALHESLAVLQIKYNHLQSEVTAIRKSAWILKRQARQEGRKEGHEYIRANGGPFMSGALLD